MTTWSSTEKLVFGAMLGLGAAYVLSRRGARKAAQLDLDLPEDQERVVQMALMHERDPAILHSLAAKLGAAGHYRSAEAAASRAEQVRGSYYSEL